MTKLPKPYIGAAFDSLTLVVARAGHDKTAFMQDSLLQDATLMRLLDAGEQFARIRDNFPEYFEAYATPSWLKLIGLRNIIAHGYLTVDYETVWDIIQAYLPDLVTELRGLL